MKSWLRRWATPLVPRLRLLTLPPAGGAAHLFRPWASHLPLDVELVAVELPGHGSRLAEPLITTMDELVDGLLPEVRAPHTVPTAHTVPTVVLGHSMGAIAALALCRRLRDLDPDWVPEMLIVVGSESRRSRRAVDGLVDATPDRLREFLVETHAGPNRDPSAAVFDPTLQNLVLPALRADIDLLGAYQTPDAPPLRCPVRVLAGIDDPFVDAVDRMDWAAESNGDFAVHLFAGGHFFYEQPAATAAVLAHISDDLNGLVTRERV